MNDPFHITELLSIQFLGAIPIVGLAGLIRGFAGFGSGMLMAPIFSLLFGPVDTVLMVVLLDSGATLQLLPSVRRHIEWRFVGLMGLTAAMFMPLGSWILVTVDPAILTKIIAIIVLTFVFVLMTGWRYRGAKNPLLTMAIGSISGAMMAATSLGNPPVMIYMLAGPDDAVTNRANITAYFAVTLTALLLIMSLSGLVALAPFLRVIMLFPIYVLSTWLGSSLFSMSSEIIYRRIALIFILCAGLVGLISS